MSDRAAVRLTLVAPHPVPEALVEHAERLLGPGCRRRAAEGPPAGGASAWHALHLHAGSSVRPDTDALRELCRAHGTDLALVRGPLAVEPPALVVMDVDSTLITGEVIELLAEHAGTAPAVAAVTERAMRGELDFAASLRERVATLAGLPQDVVQRVGERVRLTPGARELVAAVHRAGGRVGLVSGGFIEIVGPLAAGLGVDHVRANALEVAGGRLTGRTTGPVVDRAAKARALREWASADGVPLDRTVAVGDGANDLDMLDAAALGIAFCAKPVVRQAADAAVTFPRLDAAAVLAGLDG